MITPIQLEVPEFAAPGLVLATLSGTGPNPTFYITGPTQDGLFDINGAQLLTGQAWLLSGIDLALASVIVGATYSDGTSETQALNILVTDDNLQLSLDTLSPDGSKVIAPDQASELLLGGGRFSFAGLRTSSPGNYIVLHNGADSHGSGVLLEAWNSGKCMLKQANGRWWIWGGTGWLPATLAQTPTS